jgi:hypothetical protein
LARKSGKTIEWPLTLRDKLVVELNRSLRDADSQMHRRTIDKAKSKLRLEPKGCTKILAK